MIKVGIFDSGIGGLSILKEIVLKNLPVELFYYADSKNAPYGPKPDTFVKERSRAITQEFVELGAQIVIVACNTATAVAIDDLRLNFPNISFIGVEPYINVINQRPELKAKRGLVLATPLTGNSKRFKDLKERLDPQNLLDTFLPPNLAKIIEDNFLESFENIYPMMRNEFTEDLSLYDFYILGCTHYPLVKKELEKIFKGELISPCPMVAKRFVAIFEKISDGAHDAASKDIVYPIKIFMSGKDDHFRILDLTKILQN